jgi:hypothetical protein
MDVFDPERPFSEDTAHVVALGRSRALSRQDSRLAPVLLRPVKSSGGQE